MKLADPESPRRDGGALLPSVILEGTRLAPVATAGELCLAGLHLLQDSERWSVEHPLMAGCRVVRTGHSAVLDKQGRCRVLSAPDEEISQRGIDSRGTVSGCCGARTSGDFRSMKKRCPAGMSGWPWCRHPPQWTAFAERLDHANHSEPTPLDLESALTYLKQGSAPQLLPAAWVVKDKLPLLGTGRVDRERLRAEIDALVPTVDYEAPQGEIEEALARSGGAAAVERVGRADDFFALGGHSLLGCSWSRASAMCWVGDAVREVFEHSDLKVAGAADRGEVRQRRAAPEIVTVDRSEPLPLSFAQQRLWFLSRMMPPNAVYNIPLALQVAGRGE